VNQSTKQEEPDFGMWKKLVDGGGWGREGNGGVKKKVLFKMRGKKKKLTIVGSGRTLEKGGRGDHFRKPLFIPKK